MKFFILICLSVSVSARSIEDFGSFENALQHEIRNYDFDANHIFDSRQFENFKSDHNKKYESEEEESKRYRIFRTNLLAIKLLNTFGSAKYGVNQFADMENEEFLFRHTGLKRSKNQNEKEINFSEAVFDKNDILPKKVDWREKGAVTEVKNQYFCGSCWAFSATGAVESQNKIVNGELLRLSEQELVDCDIKSFGCEGGFMTDAYAALMKLGGSVLEYEYPYRGKNQICHFFHMPKNSTKVHVMGYVKLTQNEDDIAQYVAQKGPVSVAMNAVGLKHYQGGILDAGHILCDPEDENHGVLIVGFDVDDESGEPIWVIKNSWGHMWGENGYFRIKRGANICGIAQNASAPIVAKKLI